MPQIIIFDKNENEVEDNALVMAIELLNFKEIIHVPYFHSLEAKSYESPITFLDFPIEKVYKKLWATQFEVTYVEV